MNGQLQMGTHANDVILKNYNPIGASSKIYNLQLQELAWSMGEVFNAGIHPPIADRLGIKTGDIIEIEAPNGRKVTAVSRVTLGVHPKVISTPGNAARVLSPDGKRVVGNGVHLNSFLPYEMQRVDMLSAALDACVKVRIRKVRDVHAENGPINALKKSVFRILSMWRSSRFF